jgi:hypothetical protein
LRLEGERVELEEETASAARALETTKADMGQFQRRCHQPVGRLYAEFDERVIGCLPSAPRFSFTFPEPESTHQLTRHGHASCVSHASVRPAPDRVVSTRLATATGLSHGRCVLRPACAHRGERVFEIARGSAFEYQPVPHDAMRAKAHGDARADSLDVQLGGLPFQCVFNSYIRYKTFDVAG